MGVAESETDVVTERVESREDGVTDGVSETVGVPLPVPLVLTEILCDTEMLDVRDTETLDVELAVAVVERLGEELALREELAL